MRTWNKLPDYLKTDEIRPYYDLIKRKWFYRFVKRTFDIFASFVLFFVLLIPSLIIGLVIVCTSKGGPFFLQQRVGRYGKMFKIIKFRTMKKNSEGNQQITHNNDSRITNVGKFLRKTHLDEFPQLINVLLGEMSFVGTRPEVKQFVDRYQIEWYATLLMRPGITSTASYSFADEAKQLEKETTNEHYLNIILPKKMQCNLRDMKEMDVLFDIKTLWKTIIL